MADDKIDLSNYVEVRERIEAFYEKHPEGSLQSDWEITKFGENIVLVVTARAYRDREDEKPGVGTASEPYPGRTPYTKDSELMNAETSAWGRALAALGFKVDRGIASANEVRGRSSGGKKPPSEGQLDFFESLIKGLVPDLEAVMDYAQAELTGGKGGTMSKAIDGLKNAETKGEIAERLQKAAAEHKAVEAQETPEEEGK